MSKAYYVACWTEDSGLYACVHHHPTVADALKCVVPDGGHFVRAHEAGVYRSLNDDELQDFMQALPATGWRKSA